MGADIAPRHNASDYASALRSLLPTGPAWEEEHENLAALIEGLASVFDEPLDRIAALFLDTESDPRFTRQLLSDWEKAFGLPDDCLSTPQTIDDRINALINRMTLQGGQSIAFFIALAKALGYTIEITEFSPFMAGVSEVGSTRPMIGICEATLIIRAIYPDIVIVLDYDVTDPPMSPMIGDAYVLGNGCTGDWSDQDQTVATWNGANWEFASPVSDRIGGRVAVYSTGEILSFDLVVWKVTSNWSILPSFHWFIGPPEMRFYWQVHVGGARLSWFRAASGESGVQHHLEFSIAEDLECILRRYKPAHTEVVFDYSRPMDELDAFAGAI